MTDLLAHIAETIHKHTLLRRRQAVLVAVSGGLDSMVLLHALRELSERDQWKLTIAHFNHCLRGVSSGADERLVVRTAKALRLPIVTERASVKHFARERKISIEMAARELRHAFLARTASRLRIKTIAVAHHADDQVELFFLRLLRGSGSEGLAGMKWRGDAPGDQGAIHGEISGSPDAGRVELVRPLLDLPKSVLHEFAVENKIHFREDASNESPDFLRNRVRHDLLPLLRDKYQSALDRTIARVMEIVRAESEFLGQVAADWLGAEVRALRLPADFWSLPVAVQRRCVQLQLQRQRIAASFDLIENLRLHPERPIKVSPDLAVVLKSDGRLGLEPGNTLMEPNYACSEIILNSRPGKLVFSNVQFTWRTTARRGRAMPEPQAGREVFDADKVGDRVVLRHWRPGDRFQPIGMKSPVKLQDLFVNRKIPRAERHGLVVAETARGEIFWVEQFRIAERFKLSRATTRCLQWRWKRA